MAVAQNTYSVNWFKGKELNMVFGLQLSFSRVVSFITLSSCFCFLITAVFLLILLIFYMFIVWVRNKFKLNWIQRFYSQFFVSLTLKGHILHWGGKMRMKLYTFKLFNSELYFGLQHVHADRVLSFILIFFYNFLL